MPARTSELVRRKFREYLFPTILTSLAMSLAAVVDSIMVGNLLGDTALAAVGLCTPPIYCINFIYMLFGVGGMTLASVARGQLELRKANTAFTLTIVLGTGAMAAFLVVVLVFIRPITTALAGGDESLAQLTAAYLTPLLFTGPGLMFSSGMALFIRTDGSPKSSAAIVLIANAVNLVLDYVFIVFFDSGIAGAGASTSIGYAAGVFVVLPYLFRKDRSFRFVKLSRDARKVLPEMLKMGMPKATIQMTSFFRQIILNALILSLFSVGGMTAMSVCINILMISNIFVTGTSDALLPIVGTLYGEQDYYGIRAAMRSASRVAILAAVALCAFFMLFPETVAGWFGASSDSAVLVPAIEMFALYLPFNAANVIYENFYTTTGRANLASVMAFLDGLAYVVPLAFALSVTGLGFWLCYAVSGALTFLTAVLWSRRIARRKSLVGMLLLPSDETLGEVLDLTIPAEPAAATALSRDVQNFCLEHGVTARTANRLAVCAEEMAANTAHIASEHHSAVAIDVFVHITEQDIVLRFRDDGEIFDPATYQGEALDGCTTDGIEVMKKLAEKTEYARQLGFNSTVLTFSRSTLRADGA